MPSPSSFIYRPLAWVIATYTSMYNYALEHRMLGFDDAACAVTTNKFGTAENSVPFLMDSVQCLGHEEALDQCTFTGWGNTVYLCSHRSNYAGVVCANSKYVHVLNCHK